MREIKFRGQHIDTKEWVYGDLVQVINHPTGLKAYIAADGDTKLFYPGCRFCEINPETIGQFTGLHDKNGKEIYEGDIVKGHSTGQYVGLIHFAYGEYRIGCKGSALIRLLFNCDPDRSLCDEWKFIEVIGNIHENKEDSCSTKS